MSNATPIIAVYIKRNLGELQMALGKTEVVIRINVDRLLGRNLKNSNLSSYSGLFGYYRTLSNHKCASFPVIWRQILPV